MKISMSKGRLLAVLALLLGCALLWRGFFEPGSQRGMPQDTPPVPWRRICPISSTVWARWSRPVTCW